MNRKNFIQVLITTALLCFSLKIIYAGVKTDFVQSSTLQMTNGAGTGKVLTSDTTGYATWQTGADATAIGVATATLRTDLSNETSSRISADNSIGIATATLRTDVNAKVNRSGDTMTGTLNAPDVNATYGVNAATLTINTGIKFAASPAAGKVLTSDAGGNATWQNVPAGVSDHGQLTSTGTLTHAQLENDLISIGIATGTLRTDLTAETNARIGADSTIGIATATLRTDVDAKVNRSGDTMTGTLNAPDVVVTYGVNTSTLIATGFRYNDGNQAVGKVLTSDASGNAIWQNNSAGTGLLSSTNTWTANQTFNNLNITAKGDIQTADASAFYFGDPGNDGTWKVQRSGSDLVYYRKESTLWVEKYRVIP